MLATHWGSRLQGTPRGTRPHRLWQCAGNSACLLRDSSQAGLRAGCPWGTSLHPSSNSTGTNSGSQRPFSQDYLSLPWADDPGADPSSLPLFSTALPRQVTGCVLCSSPVKSLMSIKLLLEKVFSKGNPSFSQKRAHCILAANCPAAFLLGRPSWDTAESQGTSQGLVKTGQCGVVSQTSGKFNGWWRVISSGWKWPSHTRIPVFSMERNKLLGLRLSDLFYHVF